MAARKQLKRCSNPHVCHPPLDYGFFRVTEKISRPPISCSNWSPSDITLPLPKKCLLSLSVYECAQLFKFHPPNLFSRLLKKCFCAPPPPQTPSLHCPLQYSTQFSQLDATSFNYSNIGECGRSKKIPFCIIFLNLFNFLRSYTRQLIQRYSDTWDLTRFIPFSR